MSNSGDFKLPVSQAPVEFDAFEFIDTWYETEDRVRPPNGVLTDAVIELMAFGSSCVKVSMDKANQIVYENIRAGRGGGRLGHFDGIKFIQSVPTTKRKTFNTKGAIINGS